MDSDGHAGVGTNTSEPRTVGSGGSPMSQGAGAQEPEMDGRAAGADLDVRLGFDFFQSARYSGSEGRVGFTNVGVNSD